MTYNTFLDPSNTTDPRTAAQTAALKAFAKAYPNINVQISVDPSSANVPKAIATRTGTPDIFRVTEFTLAQYVAQGGLTQLDDYMDRDGVSRDDWLLPLTLNQVKGKTYTLQQDYRIPVLLYRKNAYTKAGISTPPATFDDVYRVTGDLSASGTMAFPFGFGSDGGTFDGQAFLEYLGSSMLIQKSKGKYFASDGLEPEFSKEAVEDCASIVKEMYARKASQLSALNWGFTEGTTALETGTASSEAFGLYRFNTIKTSGAQDLTWAPPPAYAAGGKQTVYGYTLAINKYSPNKEAAWEFVKFMTSAKTQAGIARGGEVVARKSAYNDPYFATPDAKNVVGWKKLVLSQGLPVSYSQYYSQFGVIVSNAMTEMILHNGSAAAAADEIMTKYAALLHS